MITKVERSMSMPVARAAAGLLVMTLCAAAAACGSPDVPAADAAPGPLVLGFVNGADTEFHTCLQKAVEATANIRGVKLLTTNSHQKPDAELSNIDDLIRLGVDALIVQTVDVQALHADITRANAAGIPIFLTSVSTEDGAGL